MELRGIYPDTKYYKPFDADLKYKGFQFKTGKILKTNQPANIFNFYKDLIDCFSEYPCSKTKTIICEVKPLGKINSNRSQTIFNSDKIEIVRELNWNDIFDELNFHDKNTDCKNTDDFNNEKYEKFNSNHSNIGDKNTGCWNIGDRNSGDWNNGCQNSGNHNQGNRNSGDWNAGTYSAGCFNTNCNPKIIMFDKLSDWTFDDWNNSRAKEILDTCPQSYPVFMSEFETMNEYRKQIFVSVEERRKWWVSLPAPCRKEIMALPNFNWKKFRKCIDM